MKRHVGKACIACRLCGATFASFSRRSSSRHWRQTHPDSFRSEAWAAVFIDKRASQGQEMKQWLLRCFQLQAPDHVVTVPNLNPFHMQQATEDAVLSLA
jgi:hypothetical protein